MAAVEKQPGADLLVSDIATQGILTIDRNQMETDISNSLDFGPDTNDSVTTPNRRHSLQADLIQENSIDALDHQRQRDRESKQDELDVIDSMTTSCFQGQTSNERHQPQADTSFTSASAPRGHIPYNSVITFPQNLVPITTTLLDGKNYHCWVHQMEFFLKQLKVACVLKDPCPSISLEATSFEENVQARAMG